MKIWLIQAVIAPYRVKLFEEIANTDGVDFSLILLSTKFLHRPNWKSDYRKMPFRVEPVSGLTFKVSHEKQMSLNPFIIFKMLKDRPGVIICGGYNLSTVLALAYKKLFGGRYLIWSESIAVTERKISRLKRSIRKMIIRNSCCFVDAGVLSRRYLESYLPENHGKKFFTSYNCIDVTQFRADSSFEDPFSGRQMPEKKILFVGMLNKRKGVVELMEAYRKVAAKQPEVALVMVGEGPLEGYIKDFCREHGLDKVYLEGWIKYGDVAKYYRHCDVFTLLSHEDPNPLVIFEALATETPILCTKNAGNAVEFVIEDKNGFVVDPDDTDASANYLLEMLSWNEDKKAEAKRVSNEVLSKANYESSAAAFIEACRYCLGKQKVADE